MNRSALATLAFALAAVLMAGVAFAAALVIEARSATAVSARLEAAGMPWALVETDGLQVRISGVAPNEAARFRALNVAAEVVEPGRVRDRLDVAPATTIAPPRFSVEMLRNDDGIQLIGLFPETPGQGGLTEDDLVTAANGLAPDTQIVNMLQTADYPAPDTWDAALQFGLEALKTLKRSKISVAANRVEVTAIAESEDEKRRFETDLGRRKPEGVAVVLDVSAPRPVLTPFTLRFVIDDAGARFDACSADTERARALILSAATAAGAQGTLTCTVGMGTPSPRWAEAAVAAIRAVAAMGAGSVTFSDADVTLMAGDAVAQDAFDRAAGDLRAALPDAFSLETIPPKVETADQGPAEFTATLSAEGRAELRGRLVDEGQQAAIDAFARAAFGAAQVYSATRLDADLPDGWPLRVLAGIEALAELHEGSLLVRADTVEVRGVTGSQQSRARITQILSSRLGQGATFRVDVRYDEELDPLAALPTPAECLAELTAVAARSKITFTPGSAEIAPEAGPVLDALAASQKDCPPLQVEIAGHTDAQGSEGGNLALSQARAEAVLVALQGRRVDVSLMTAQGYGEARPIADNGSEEGREANRRIEFVALAEDGAVAAAPAGATVADGDADADADDAEAARQAADTAAADAADATRPSVAPTEMTIRPRARPENPGAQDG